MATLLLAMAAIALRPLDHAASGRRGRTPCVAFLSRPVEGVIGLAMLVVPAGELMRSFWSGPERPARHRLAPARPARRGPGGIGGVGLPGCSLSADTAGKPGG